MNHDSSDGIAIGYGLEDRGIEVRASDRSGSLHCP
jgi:hypothetical protein